MRLQNRVKNIGKIEGELLVFGGVYSNLQALEELYALAQKQNIPATNIICTGDMVGYCAQPVEVLDFIKDWGIHVILGNVEIQLKEGEEDCGCNFDNGSRCDIFSKQWYPYAQSQVQSQHIEWLNQLPEFIRFQYAGKDCFVLHGGIEDTSAFIFESTEWGKKADVLISIEADVVFAGHCGLPFSSRKNDKYWINPGVIGMPANDGTTRVWCMLLSDESQFSFEHMPLTYDHQKAHDLMHEKGLPKTYAQTLLNGIWDNCEILPEEETAKQGQKISF